MVLLHLNFGKFALKAIKLPFALLPKRLLIRQILWKAACSEAQILLVEKDLKAASAVTKNVSKCH